MRRLRTLLFVVALGVVAVMPSVASAENEPQTLSWWAAVERFAGWMEGVWRAVAGSETEPPQAPSDEPPVGIGIDLSEAGLDELEEGGETESFPKTDPNG